MTDRSCFEVRSFKTKMNESNHVWYRVIRVAQTFIANDATEMMICDLSSCFSPVGRAGGPTLTVKTTSTKIHTLNQSKLADC